MPMIHTVVHFIAFPGYWLKHNIIEILGLFRLKSPSSDFSQTVDTMLVQYPKSIKEYIVRLTQYISLEETSLKIIATFSVMNLCALWFFSTSLQLLQLNSAIGWILLWIGISIIIHSFPSALNTLLFQTQFIISKNTLAKCISLPFLLFFKAITTLDFIQSRLLYAICLWATLVLFL